MTLERRHVLVAAVIAVVALVVAAVLIVPVGGGHAASKQAADTARGLSGSSSPAAAGSSGAWTPVFPSTTVPTDTPVQQQYDRAFEQGFTSAANKRVIAATESLALPAPAIEGGWPALKPANSPEAWTTEFVEGLLNVDFAHQSRQGLGAWIVAQEAPDLMPGVPVRAQLPGLYATVMAPDVTGMPSPAPSKRQWRQDAAAGVRWSVSDLEVQPDPQWQSMIAAGWQPADLYAAVEDVSGVIDISQGRSTTSKTFSLVVQLGSAHWHHGYGAVLVSGWKET